MQRRRLRLMQRRRRWRGRGLLTWQVRRWRLCVYEDVSKGVVDELL